VGKQGGDLFALPLHCSVRLVSEVRSFAVHFQCVPSEVLKRNCDGGPTLQCTEGSKTNIPFFFFFFLGFSTGGCRVETL
jgi:hypothetical protein